MYNKLFAKILDSSIWLQPTATRIVWLTFIAVMDEDGFVQFASVGNVAQRAVVTLEEAQEAIRCLESPDPESSDPENDGRRIERVPGGWMVLNAHKHRDLVTRAVIKEQTRERVKRFRDRLKRERNGQVTPSVSEVPSDTEEEPIPTSQPVTVAIVTSRRTRVHDDGFDRFWQTYPRRVGKGAALREWQRIKPDADLQQRILDAVEVAKTSRQWLKDGGQFIPHPSTWLHQQRWDDDPEPQGPMLNEAETDSLSAIQRFVQRTAQKRLPS